MSQTNNIYYSVEPYTGDIICHYRTEGAKNGYHYGKLIDPNKIAKQARDMGLKNRLHDYYYTGGRDRINEKINNLKKPFRYSNLNPFAKSNRNKDAKDARVKSLNKKGYYYYIKPFQKVD